MLKIIDPISLEPIDEQRAPQQGDFVEEIKGNSVVRYWYSTPIYPGQKIIDISINKPSNTLADFDDKDTQYTVTENTDSIATGTGLSDLYALGLKRFRVPFVRTDTNRKVYMVADIAADGTFTITVNFKTGGEWIVNSDLLNSELSQEELALFKFRIAEHKFKVV